MNIELKIQLDALKHLYANKPLPVRYVDSGYGYVYMTLDGYTAVRILENDFWLDKNKLSKSPLLARSLEQQRDAIDKAVNW